MTIITQLLGGLGNQMFQVAAGLALARRTAGELFIDTGLLRDHRLGRHAVNRPFDLGLFATEFIEAPLQWRLRHNAHGFGLGWKVASRLLRTVAPLEVTSERSFVWQAIEPERMSLRPLYIEGLWQSWRYFAEQESGIREAFKFRQDLPAESLSLAAQLRNETAVAIHVRRGDYVNNPKDAVTLGFIGIEYYRRAVFAVCHTMKAQPRFFVFSDDLEWCKSNLKWLPGPVTYVEQKAFGNRPVHHLDFQVLSQANRFVLSNSTFAWWAAWLSSSLGKQIIAPKAWFRDASIDASDLCPPDWMLV